MTTENQKTNTELTELETKAWTIHNILRTLYVALPDDSMDAEVPTRSLVGNVYEMAEGLAMALGDMDFKQQAAAMRKESAA